MPKDGGSFRLALSFPTLGRIICRLTRQRSRYIFFKYGKKIRGTSRFAEAAGHMHEQQGKGLAQVKE